MTGNPEFRRNLALELTPHRLVAVPLVLGLIFVTAWAIDGPRATAAAGRLVMTVLLALWGARAAADAVFGEVTDRTWDAQRMSSIGPWAMSWGKLFGAPVFSWYGSLFCAPAVLMGTENPVNALVEILLFGLLAHALALMISLLLLRIRGKRTRFQVNIAHAGGILFALAAGGVGLFDTGPARELAGEPYSRVSWYGIRMSLSDFSFVTRIVLLAWAVIGVFRLMRLELQFKPQPLVWLGFVLFVSAYVGGVSFGLPETAPLLTEEELALVALLARLGAGLAFVVLLTYCAIFLAPSGAVHLRRLAWELRDGRYYAAFRTAPPWMVAALVAIVQTIAVCVVTLSIPEAVAGDVGPVSEFARSGASDVVVALIAWMLFLLRDLGLILFVILSPRGGRGHLAAAMYLGILYIAIPALLSGTGLQAALPVFIPFAVHSPGWLLPILAQLGLLAVALTWRWRQISVAPDPVPASA